MSETLTRLDDFQAAPWLPSMLSMQPQPEYEFGSLINSSPLAPTSPVSMLTSASAAQGKQEESLALTVKSIRNARLAEFGNALNDAIELSNAMVADDESAPLNPHTLIYAVEAIVPFIVAMELPPPLILPLQNGGIGVEWHFAGMNIELRFRKPYHVYAVLEDARGEILPFYGRDPHLVRTRAALREFSSRPTAG
jgi:hypothetical protein